MQPLLGVAVPMYIGRKLETFYIVGETGQDHSNWDDPWKLGWLDVMMSMSLHMRHFSCRTDRDEDDIEDVCNILESYALQVSMSGLLRGVLVSTSFPINGCVVV